MTAFAIGADRFPEVNDPKHIRRGGYDAEGLWLD